MEEIPEKFYEFHGLLKERVVDPINNTDIKESCTATLLLIFSVIDALSKITCNDEDYAKMLNKRGNRDRFVSFLENVMGQEYASLKDTLYDLRNDVVHTGIGTKVILSKSRNRGNHLQEIEGHLWIDTRVFLNDLEEAIKRIEVNVLAKQEYHTNVSARLNNLNIIHLNDCDEATPSPGADEALFQ